MLKSLLKNIRPWGLAVVCAAAGAVMGSCIEDGISTSPSDQPEFSVDTLAIGDVFTDETTPTCSFKVYNRHDKVMSISSIRFTGANDYFRLNVDGQSGRVFSNVEIRPNDSIFVFVDVNLPPNGSFDPLEVTDAVEFITNGVTKKVPVTACGQDIERIRGLVITGHERWSGDRPRQIFDSLVVAPGASLTIEAGSKLYFHDKSRLKVHGTLVTLGTAEKPVEMTGDRRGTVITDVSFDLMSRQWEGVDFTTTSHDNSLAFTEIRNTWTGVRVDSVPMGAAPALEMVNCRLRNADSHAFSALHSWIRATGCEFAEAGAGSVSIIGGRLDMDHCTLSNYYLFSVIRGACLQLGHLKAPDNGEPSQWPDMPYLKAEITNTVIYGSSADMSPTSLDGTDAYLRRCLLRSAGNDDDHFIDIIWDKDPLFHTVRADYLFDYRPKPDSPVAGASVPTSVQLPATDFYGAPRPATPAIGAYEPCTEQHDK